MLDFLKKKHPEFHSVSSSKKNPDLHEYHRNSHSKYLIQYHFVFAVKYRKKLLTGEIKDDIQQFFYDIANQSKRIKDKEIAKDSWKLRLIFNY